MSFSDSFRNTNEDGPAYLAKKFHETTAEVTLYGYTATQWMKAFSDLVDGHNEYDLQSATGLSIERCRELREMFNHINNIN